MSLARVLAREANHAVGQGCDAEDITAGIRPFLAAPAPHTFLMAARALKALRRQSRVSEVLTQQRKKKKAAALDLLRATGASGEMLATALVNGAADKKAADRITALACLLGSYEELESRAQEERDELRARLGL